MDIGLVVSIGTGAIPIRNLERINFSSLASLSGKWDNFSGVGISNSLSLHHFLPQASLVWRAT